MDEYSVIFDFNERQRMLEEGYRPEVIEFHARERFEEMQADFRRKNAILGQFYEPTPYYDFVGDVFPGIEKLMVVTGEETYKEMDLDELMEYQALRSNVYVAPATFINGCYSGSTCHNLFAFVVDIDKIRPDTLDAIIKNGNLGNETPMPTYIVNSGSGVHFYYVFREPVPYYYKNRKMLKDMYRTLCGITKKNILAKTDWHAITQPFRLPGSQTKLGQTVTGWKCGDKWPAKTLARRLGVDAGEMDLQQRPLLSQREYQEEKARREEAALEADPAAKPKKKRKNRNEWRSSLEGNTGFYLSCLQRCYEETEEGSRYYSMLALTMVARKCTYPKEQLEQDLMELLQHYNRIGKYMGHSEVRKALKAYNPKALQCPSEQLEIWFGWEFDRLRQKQKERQKVKPKQTNLSRTEIMEKARKIQDVYFPEGEWRNTAGAPTKEQAIRAWRFANPDGKPKDCIRETGISKNTVYKWWNSKPAAAPEVTAQPAYYRYTPDGMEPVYLEEG